MSDGFISWVLGKLAWRVRWVAGVLSRVIPAPKPEAAVNRILCIVGGGIGDRLLALPALRFLREEYPQAHICIAWFDGGIPVRDTRFQEEYVFNRGDIMGKVRLAARGFDLCFVSSLGYLSATCDVCALVSRARIRRGPRPGGYRKRLVYNLAYEDPPGEHITVVNARGAGWHGTQRMLPYPIRHLAFPNPVGMEETTDSVNLVVFHVGCNPKFARKRWDPGRYRELITLLAAEPGRELALIGDRSEAALMETIAQGLPVSVNILADVGQWLDWLKRASVFVGNDSGPAHLAAAMGTATIVVMSPTDPALCQPVFDRGAIVYQQCDVGACYYISGECRRCIDRITADQVAAVVARLLSEGRGLGQPQPSSSIIETRTSLSDSSASPGRPYPLLIKDQTSNDCI